jgi:hypothetical protein
MLISGLGSTCFPEGSVNFSTYNRLLQEKA